MGEQRQGDAGASAPGIGREWYVVALCTVAYVFSFIDRQILTLMITPIKADLGISDTQFGLLHGLAFAIFYATMGLPIAGLADRISRPLIIGVSVFFWSLATMAGGLAANFWQLFLARIGVGAGEAGLSPATYSLIADIFPREKLGRAIAVYSLGSFFGSGIAFLVGGAAIAMVGTAADWSLLGWQIRPWQAVFLIVGFPGLLLGALIYLTVAEPRGDRTSASAPTAPPFRDVFAMLKAERGIFLPHMVGYSLAAMALFSLLGWIPAWLGRSFDVAPRDLGLMLGLIVVLSCGSGVLTSGWLMDRLGRSRGDAPFITGCIGAAGTVLPALAFAFVPTMATALAAITLCLFFASFPMPPSTAVMQIVPPANMRSRVSAILLCANSLGGLALGSFFVGLLNDHLFADVGQSLAVVVGGSSALSAIILLAARGPYRAFLQR